MANALTITDAGEVFAALETWIKRRPKLDPADYGLGTGQCRERGQWREAYRAYSSELRSIAADRKRALDLLLTARALQPARPELLADSFRAFSGRLEWVPAPCNSIGVTTGLVEGRLEYTTGQYFPTEYRKAAAAVLDAYIRAYQRAENELHPKRFTYHTMDDVRAANAATGGCWFDRSTMKFFGTRIESPLIAGKRFVTSEQPPHGRRVFTVREATPEGDIDTIGEFCGHATRREALAAARDLEAA